MAKVEIPARYRNLTAGTDRLEIDAGNVRQLVTELDSRYPGLADELRRTATVAIDGEIVADSMTAALLKPLADDSEVLFVPAVSGG